MSRWSLRRRATVRQLSVPDFRALFPAAFRIFADAMEYPDSYVGPRVRLATTQLSYPGITAFGAFERSTLVGFAYGYRIQAGQWWADEVERAMYETGRKDADDWLSDAFELCEIHVTPGQQGRGTGRRLLHALTAAQPCPVILLSTPSGPTKAAGLYASEGYLALASRFRFAGDPRDFEILGKRVGRG